MLCYTEKQGNRKETGSKWICISISAKELDCFESDLRNRSYISWPAASVRHVKVAADDAQAWSEFLTYVFGVPLDFSTVDAAKLYLLKHRCLPDDL